MKWKCLLLTLALACGISAGGEAYDMNAVAAASLPKGFTYREAAGTETLHFMEKDIPYQMGQLQYTLEKQQSFSSGYIIRALLPVEMAEALKPYFKMNRDEHVWRRLTQMNRALLNPTSPLRKGIEANRRPADGLQAEPRADGDADSALRGADVESHGRTSDRGSRP